MKWKEITSCIISLYIVRFIFIFLTLLLPFGWSAAGAASGCCDTPHLYFGRYWCDLGGKGGGGQVVEWKGRNTKEGKTPQVRKQQS